MKTGKFFQPTKLSLILGALPPLAYGISYCGGGDFLLIILTIGPILLYDYLGIINFNILGGSSTPAEDFLYIATSSVFLYLFGKLIVILFRLKKY